MRLARGVMAPDAAPTSNVVRRPSKFDTLDDGLTNASLRLTHLAQDCRKTEPGSRSRYQSRDSWRYWSGSGKARLSSTR